MTSQNEDVHETSALKGIFMKTPTCVKTAYRYFFEIKRDPKGRLTFTDFILHWILIVKNL